MKALMFFALCFYVLCCSTALVAQFVGQTCDLETEFSTLVPCLPFLQMQDEHPSQECCVRVHSVLKEHFPCMCTLIDDAGGMVGHILNDINFTQAMDLPSLCDVSGFDPSHQCGSFGGIGATPLFANPNFSAGNVLTTSVRALWMGLSVLVLVVTFR